MAKLFHVKDEVRNALHLFHRKMPMLLPSNSNSHGLSIDFNVCGVVAVNEAVS